MTAVGEQDIIVFLGTNFATNLPQDLNLVKYAPGTDEFKWGKKIAQAGATGQTTPIMLVAESISKAYIAFKLQANVWNIALQGIEDGDLSLVKKIPETTDTSQIYGLTWSSFENAIYLAG